MRVLLDNATLTASFRALGLIKSRVPDLFELDVCALRVFVDSIILADKIVILDTYKPEHTTQRKKWLDHCDVVFEPVSEALDEYIQKNAIAHVHNWNIQRHLSTDLVGLFNDISILFRHAWRNSESFLVLKSFTLQNKYNSALVKGLMDYIGQHRQDSRREILKFTPKGYNEETNRVAQSVAWAAVRTVYYRQAAKILGCEYSSHPLRNVFNMKCILFDNHPFTRKHKWHSERKPTAPEEIQYRLSLHQYYDHINHFFRNFWQDCNKADDNIFGVETFDVDMPPFLSLVIKSARDACCDDLLRVAFRIRDRSDASALRHKLSQIYKESSEMEKRQTLRGFIAELRDLKHGLQRYLGYDRERVPITLKAVTYDLTVPRCMTKPLYPHKPHLAFIRDVILELSNAASLGRQIDYLWGHATS
jgi:hypothetical protein